MSSSAGRWYSAVLRLAQLDANDWAAGLSDRSSARRLVEETRVLVAFVPPPEARPPLPAGVAATVRNNAYRALSAVSANVRNAVLGPSLASRLEMTLPLLIAEEARS